MFAIQCPAAGYLVGYVRTTEGRRPVFDRNKRQAECYATRRHAAEGKAKAEQTVLPGPLAVVKVS